MNTIESWKTCFTDAGQTLERFTKLPGVWEKLESFSEAVFATTKGGGNIFVCGNGGSHCDALHFAEEFTGRYRKDRKPVGVLALGDAPHTTCVANDFGFDHVFSRQLEALGRKGDCLILLSTSGNSKNQLMAVESAKRIGIKTIALLGKTGGKLQEVADHCLVVPSDKSERVQEIHIKILHTLVETVERRLFPELY